jgi:hypothetical protein
VIFFFCNFKVFFVVKIVNKITMIVTGKRFLWGLPLDVCLLWPNCGSPTGLSDFRPISILLVLSKGLERLICDQFVDNLDSGGLFFPYRKFRSTANALTKIMDDIHLGVAFDSMAHDLALHKLRFKFGLSSTACRWFCSFLGPRTQEGYDDW